MLPYLISERGQKVGANCQGAGAGILAQVNPTRRCVAREVENLEEGRIFGNQVPQKILHEIPAALPLWRSLLSVLAAI